MKKWDDVKANIKSLGNCEYIGLLTEIISSIIKRRREIGLSQGGLEEKCSVKQSLIAELEALKATPRIDTPEIILNHLGLKLTIALV